MTSGRHRMPADLHIVRRIEESHIYMRLMADNASQEFGIAAVATPHAMIPEDPKVA